MLPAGDVTEKIGKREQSGPVVLGPIVFLCAYYLSMDELQGKTIIFTDLHCGLAGNKLSRLNICVNVVKEIV